jgi:hypothetical protein
MMKKCFILLRVLFGIALLVGVSLAQGQSSSSIIGRILDSEGQPLPGAEAKITSPALLGGPRVQLTDESGRFRFVLLPVGTYALEGNLQGFAPAKAEKIRLFVGQTITIDLSLRIETLQQEVTVTGTAPLVDVKDSRMLVTNLDRTAIETVGETRDKMSTNLINLAPGTTDGSSMGGSARVSNGWQMDGMAMNWMLNGSDGNYPDTTLIEEVQVSGIGANAEYGNFSGAALNFVTKSGGNLFEGTGEILYSPLAWNDQNYNASDQAFSMYTKPPRTLFFNAHIGIGGPILKDKIWFYVSGGQQQIDTEVNGVSERKSFQMPSVFVKLSYQPNPKDRFSAFVQYERYELYNTGLSTVRPIEATAYELGPDWPINLSYSHSFSNNTYLEASVGIWSMQYDITPKNGLNVSQHHDNLTGLYSKNSSYWYSEDAGHFTANIKMTHHAEEFIKGAHDFKFGVSIITGHENMGFAYAGGYTYEDNVDLGGLFGTYAYSYGYTTKARARNISVFAQDSWNISDRLTINPGIRFSMFKGTLPQAPDRTFKPANTFEPRIGLTWDIMGDHSTAFKLHYGRYVESIKTSYFSKADPGQQDWVMYFVNPDGTKEEVYRDVYTNSITIDPNIKMPSMYQFSVGLERTLTRDISVGVTYVHRDYRDFIALTNTAGAWTQVPFSFIDENGQSQTVQVYSKTSPSSADKFVISNPQAGKYPGVIVTPKNTYSGLTLDFEKRFANKWMLHASYTYGVAKGNFDNTFSAGSGGSKIFTDPNMQIFAQGNLPYDTTHLLQIYGTFVLPLDFQLSPRLTYQSGYPWMRTVRVGNIPGTPTIKIEPRGSQRYDGKMELDFRLEKFFHFSEKFRIGFVVDVFNAFNRGVITDSFWRVDLPYYGKAAKLNNSRNYRVGFRFFF